MTIILIAVIITLNTITPTSYGASNSDLEIRDKVHFVNPIDAFALYAFMNYTGYDYENYTSYHMVREGVREDLKKMNINISRPQYFKEFEGYSMLEADISMFISWIGEAPNFEMEKPMRDVLGKYVTSRLGDLDVLLTEFYREANIEELYEKYKPYYDEAIKKDEEKVYSSLNKMVNHFNLDIKNSRDFNIFINLMDMHWRGYMFDPSRIDYSTDKAYLLQTGPTPNEGINIVNVAHEFSHIFTGDILKKEQVIFKKLIIALTNEFDSPSNPSYTTWFQTVDESFVRAMSSWATDAPINHIKAEVAQGFVMTEYIFNRISDFNTNDNLDFNQWMKDIMIDYANEIYPTDDDYKYEEGYEDGYNAGYEDGKAESNCQDNTENITEDRSLYRKMESKYNVTLTKDWAVEFNLDLDLTTIAERNIFITNSQGKIHPLLYVVDRTDDLSIIKLIPARNYTYKEKYTLWIKDIKSKNGNTLAEWTLMDFTIN